tara:strand:- start:7250 stop:8812 length:1563 start_codon:yes stop_codon:yes gene_type:complete
MQSAQHTDVLIIGSGLAGATAAIAAAEEGKNVIILTKTNELKSGNTPYAQGGIVYKSNSDTPEKLKKDIINAGHNDCWEEAVNKLCNEGPTLVKKILIDKLNIDFTKKDNKTSYELTAEAAHSEKRILFCKDKTGDSIQTKILSYLEKIDNITILTNHTAIDLLTLSHHSTNTKDIYKKPACFGIMALNNLTNEVFPIYANRTILSTGGIGQLYLHTTNAPESHGDGIAMAWRAGVRCFNLHYIQFHPTALYHESGRFLISEAVRGEGGILIDNDGNEFMTKIHKNSSLAPRDIVARGIHTTMLSNNHPCVYLDITHKDKNWLQNRFPNIYSYCYNKNIDIANEPIPVVPAAHYSCGGIGVNLNGHTSLKRLYAIGEVACTGVHGANRLASTSLLESLVWGYNAGKDASIHLEGDNYFPDINPWIIEKEKMDPALIAQDWLSIKHTMWNYVGLVRTRQRLLRAQTILKNLQNDIEGFYQSVQLTPQTISLRNGIQTANAIVSSAIEAKKSKGTHYLENSE